MKNTRSNIFRDIYYQPYDDNTRLKLYSSSKASLQLIQRMSLLKSLKVHNGCVNSICWNNSGELILSGSDDQHLVLTNAYNYKVLTDYKTSHRANIFSAKFLPNSGDHRIVSCSGDGIILYTDLMRRTETFHNQFTCHTGTTYEIATIPGEPHNFLSCGEDGTVRWFDLRMKDKCSATRCREDVLISCQRAVTALSVNPVLPHQIAIGCSDSTVRTFDRRTLGTPATGWIDAGSSVRPLCSFTVPEFEGNSYRITSLSYSPDGQDVLVSYSSDHLYLFSIKDQGSLQLRKDATMGKGKGKKHPLRSPQPVRRLRLRGDWSDTGPDARPEREGGRRSGTEIAQARPVLHTSLMQRMTDVLSRMLNDPATRAALSGGGEDSLEGVIEQQEGIQNTENNGESSAERSNESAELSTEHDNNDAGTRSTSLYTDRTGSNTAETSETTNDGRLETREVEEQEYNQLASHITSTSVNHDNLTTSSSDDVPMEIESSQSDAQAASASSTSSHHRSKHGDIWDEGGNANEASRANIGSKQESMMENLQDRLTTMRDGFLERHGSEPAVSLTYSDKSSTSATISLGVGDEVTRDSYHPGPSGSCSDRTLSAGPSNNHKHRYTDIREKTEEVIDSEDEDIQPGERLLNPVEAEMDEAIANARSSQGHETFDETYLTELCVKRKYMGHRNASFFRTMIKEANFWGDDFVMSGSDCGHVFVWERDTAKLCMLLEADHHVVNCLQPHPYLPILATSGIDYDVKLWAPVNKKTDFDEKFAEDLKKRNAVMLEETKDTITVPAVFMIRMLACLNQIRRDSSDNENFERRVSIYLEISFYFAEISLRNVVQFIYKTLNVSEPSF
ncbi:DDB1- and CUL4-associated factor 6-like isoform X2 [Odontomachus brunneus]|uniref:DDB1- and CUL4-associated factor 6-like isoform X2 n=1 Tax=Odontomachus brunneus TaxID=486640 RepID=UPI0013F19109|nr:DDB1- and CUL4-associated factor 6-like isoform X2 [Odontomachus brunneus]